MGPLHSTAPAAAVASLGWPEIAARREQAGDAWPTVCPLCREPFGARDDDVRWLAEHGRLVRLPDGCAAHRYCAIENPHRDPALIAEHECDPASPAPDRLAS